MNDIEKLFKEKLGHHSVAPPSDVWERLQAAQQQQDSSRKGGWWWMAASVAVLLTLGGVFFLNERSTEPSARIAIETPTTPEVTEPSVLETPTRPTELSKEGSNSSEVASIEPSKEVRSNQTPTEIAQQPAVVDRIYRLKPVAKIEPASLVALAQSEYKVSTLPKEPIIADAFVQKKPSIVIIYKSGNTTETEESEFKNPLEKAATFLANIKESGVGFSELRSAKSELISKAFSNKREPMPAE